jgi:hypothetical protein
LSGVKIAMVEEAVPSREPTARSLQAKAEATAERLAAFRRGQKEEAA